HGSSMIPTGVDFLPDHLYVLKRRADTPSICVGIMLLPCLSMMERRGAASVLPDWSENGLSLHRTFQATGPCGVLLGSGARTRIIPLHQHRATCPSLRYRDSALCAPATRAGRAG